MSSAVTVLGYSDPALVGTNVTIMISCLVRDETTEFNTTIEFVVFCVDGGRWSPNLRQIANRCSGII